jgi:hypothetical protein
MFNFLSNTSSLWKYQYEIVKAFPCHMTVTLHMSYQTESPLNEK